MRRIKKRSLKQRTKTTKFKLIFASVFVMFLLSSIMLKNYNVSLSHQLESIEDENSTLKDNNQTMQVKIDELSSFERMNNIAKKNGLRSREGSIKHVE